MKLNKTLTKILTLIFLNLIFCFAIKADINFNLNTSAVNDSIGHYGSGFMLTLVPFSAPQNLISDLNIKFFRTQTPLIQQDYSRIKASGAEVQFLIYADYFGANYANDVWPGDNDNWEPWEQSVRNAVNLVQSNGYDVEYEIWNEPNYEQFWHRDQARFFETWKRAVNIIKSMDVNAKIAGPSVAWYDVPFMQNFLIFARDNNVQPNTLIWHELNAAEGAMYINYRANEMRNWMSSNNINVGRIVINEIVREPNMYNAAHLLSFFTALERNNIFGAHACWNDPQQGGINNCFNNTLTGVVTANHEPRSLWWLYKYYAQMEGNMIYLEGDGITGFASTQNNKTQILIGNIGTNDVVNVNYISDWLNSILNDFTGKLLIKKYSLKDNSGNAVAEPQSTDLEINYSSSGTNINLPINNSEVLYLIVEEVATPIDKQRIAEEQRIKDEFKIDMSKTAALSAKSATELKIPINDEVLSYAQENQIINLKGDNKMIYAIFFPLFIFSVIAILLYKNKTKLKQQLVNIIR